MSAPLDMAGWVEIRAALPPTPDTSPFVEIFRSHGIESTREENELLIGCLADVSGSDARAEALAADLREAGAEDVRIGRIEGVDWQEAWKQFFHPQRIGRRIIVRPSWEDAEAATDDLVIVLDPGEAFGTGDHPTTRLCLRLLEDCISTGVRVADVGCGSGILSIAACLLGAGAVDAVDVDPTAVEVARVNAARNEVSFSVDVAEGMDGMRPPYDVIVSNIISAVLIQMARDAAANLKPGGRWIVSGILRDNWPLVRRSARESGFSVEAELVEDDWVAAVLVR